ncbi:hypothetical protein NMY22_g14972 [Coprinellus aureogranulatus]|nr:hypothetical protein NMY22_g14972 [Coprinellus aureogranulatus]
MRDPDYRIERKRSRGSRSSSWPASSMTGEEALRESATLRGQRMANTSNLFTRRHHNTGASNGSSSLVPSNLDVGKFSIQFLSNDELHLPILNQMPSYRRSHTIEIPQRDSEPIELRSNSEPKPSLANSGRTTTERENAASKCEVGQLPAQSEILVESALVKAPTANVRETSGILSQYRCGHNLPEVLSIWCTDLRFSSGRLTLVGVFAAKPDFQEVKTSTLEVKWPRLKRTLEKHNASNTKPYDRNSLLLPSIEHFNAERSAVCLHEGFACPDFATESAVNLLGASVDAGRLQEGLEGRVNMLCGWVRVRKGTRTLHAKVRLCVRPIDVQLSLFHPTLDSLTFCSHLNTLLHSFVPTSLSFASLPTHILE